MYFGFLPALLEKDSEYSKENKVFTNEILNIGIDKTIQLLTSTLNKELQIIDEDKKI